MSYRTVSAGLVLSLGATCAWANPTGPQVVQGSATVSTSGSVTTVTNTPGTVIQWQSFNVSPGETVRFTQPGVVNRVPTGSSVSGAIQSPGQLFFLNGTVITAPNLHLDLAGLVNSSLKFDALPASAREAGDTDVRGGRLLTGGKMFIIGPELSRFNRPGTHFVLAPGTAGELGDVRVPFVRVHVAAPAGKPLDVESVVARRPQIGIFNALFLPAETRLGAAPTAVALAFPPAPVMPTAPFAQPAQLAAFTAPVEERSMAFVPIPPAPVVERSFAFVAPAPVEERMLVAMPLVPAPVEDRLVASAPIAPVEERILVAFKLVPAPVEDRTVASAPATPVEERVLVAFKLVPAPVEDRTVASAPVAPVEERMLVAFKLVPAPVEDRLVAPAPSAPVEERVLVAYELVPAPVEDRVATPVSRPQAVAKVEQRRPEPAFAPVQVASAAPVPMIVIASPQRVAPDIVRSPDQMREPVAVKVDAPQKRMPQLMTDRKGGLFFM